MKSEARYVVDGMYIKDRSGRTVILRGCNLGGDSKIPVSDAGLQHPREVSFVGRPFAEADADLHFSRIASWGFTVIRFVITWEAVEHAGPGIYDEEYLSYLRVILKKAEEHGLSVIIDPHQDVWSRWTGGDGAPAWTLEAVGFDLSALAESGAALTSEGSGSEWGLMRWPLNYLRYATATMNTLFFAGSVFAPSMMIDGQGVQEWLQDRYIQAMTHTARRLKDCEAIIGFGLFNEPHQGFIGLKDIMSHGRVLAPSGTVCSAFDAMAAASGFTRTSRRFTLGGKLLLPLSVPLNPGGRSVFREGFSCPWKKAGVWSGDTAPIPQNRSYFSVFPINHPRRGEPVSFTEDFLKPFQRTLMQSLYRKHKHYIFFAEGIPMGERVSWPIEDRVREDEGYFSVVDAFHWYDGVTLLSRRWRPWLTADGERGTAVLGKARVKKSIHTQLERMVLRAAADGVPGFLAEFGLPFNLNRGSAYQSGDYSRHEAALASYYDGVDSNLLHSTIWNYTAGNTHAKGDGWNGEDLSVYCGETLSPRAVKGFSRPYAMAVCGTPRRMSFDTKNAEFSLEWDGEAGETEVYVPDHWYPQGWQSLVVCGTARLEERADRQRLVIVSESAGFLSIRISRRS